MSLLGLWSINKGAGLSTDAAGREKEKVRAGRSWEKYANFAGLLAHPKEAKNWWAKWGLYFKYHNHLKAL